MSNIRVIHNNALSRGSVSANTTNGGLVASNMLTESKSEIHRSTGTSVTYTISWGASETIGGVALPCTNLSSTATIRVRLYNAASAQIADSGTITAVPGHNLDLTGVTHNVNLFAFGYISKSTVWFSPQISAVRSCVINLVDTSNSAGYIDCSKIVAGPYWEPVFNVENGIQLQIVDDSDVTRTKAGESVVDIGFIYDKINFNYALLPDTDKSELARIIRKSGANKNILVSVLPNDPSSKAEQDLIIYGKRSNSSISYKMFSFYSHSAEFTSW